MKTKLLAVSLSIALLPSLALAQSYNGNLLLDSQSAVNAASVYTGVTGNLTINGADIVDLSPLGGFTTVGGYISMQGNPSLTQVIGGFQSLTDVGGGMFFYDNDSLLELSGFDALLQTGDNIDFWYNDVLQTVSGFASLQTAGWSLEFGGNPELVEIPEFLSLQTISSSLFILDNVKLDAITGFQALQYVDWSFQITGNTSLNSVCGLYDYFVLNNPYTGGGAFDIMNNGPGLPSPMTEQDVINAGPCPSAGPSIAVSAGAPGGSMTFDFAGYTASSPIAVLYGPAGSFTAPGGPCAGTTVDLVPINISSPILLNADANGDASLTQNVPGAGLGLTVQAADVATCTPSNAIVL